MKKLIALLISFALLITVFPFGVSAVTDDQQRNSLLNEKAASVFPEYADKILNPDCRVSIDTRSTTNREIVAKEARAFSDHEYFTYTEYSDGLILLSEYKFDAAPTYLYTDQGDGYTEITSSIVAWCLSDDYEGYFYLDDITYRLNDGVNNFDTITNPGTPRNGANCESAERISYEANESYYGYADVSYRINFRIGSSGGAVLNSILSFAVGEDTAVLDHYGWN